MPSIFTLSGPGEAPARRRRRKSKALGETCVVGTCRDVVNGRTGKTIALCCVGKAQSRSGQKFMSADQARQFKAKRG